MLSTRTNCKQTHLQGKDTDAECDAYSWLQPKNDCKRSIPCKMYVSCSWASSEQRSGMVWRNFAVSIYTNVTLGKKESYN